MITALLQFFDSQYMDFQRHFLEYDLSSRPLMEGPGPLFAIIASYLLFVLCLGPKYMESRKPYSITNYLIMYNLFQIIINLRLFISGVRIGLMNILLNDLLINNKTIDINYKEFASLAYIFFIVKVFELLDTVHFILKKKYELVTFLHVYHHASVCVVTWFNLKYALVEQCGVFSTLNVFVHVIMYSYYLISAMGPQYRKFLWWKKYLTTLQLVQFVIVIAYMVMTILSERDILKVTSYIFLLYALTFFILFMNFFIKTYVQKIKLNKYK